MNLFELLIKHLFNCFLNIGLLGKSKGQIMRVATVLHALFGIQEEYEFTVKVSDVAVKAALDLVNVCNEHAKIMTGRSNTIAAPPSL